MCITQGLGTILEARQLLMVVHGADKAEILAAALSGPVSPECPGSVLQLHPHVTVVADQAAATHMGACKGQVSIQVATPTA